MKKSINLLLSFILLLVVKVNAQNCEHFAFTEGASYEMEHYDSKNKKTGTSKSKVKEVTNTGGKKTALIHTENYDSKDKKGEDVDFKMVCEGTKVLFDLSPMADKMNQMKDMDISMEASFVEIPSDLSAGQSLPDGKIVIKMSQKGTSEVFSTTTITITNRKVEGKQSVTTPAGTFDTWKISSTIKMETVLTMGMKMPGATVNSVEYYNKEAGTVKTEQLNKKGEVETYSLLTKYSKK